MATFRRPRRRYGVFFFGLGSVSWLHDMYCGMAREFDRNVISTGVSCRKID